MNSKWRKWRHLRSRMRDRRQPHYTASNRQSRVDHASPPIRRCDPAGTQASAHGKSQVCLADYLSLSECSGWGHKFRFVSAKCGVLRSFWSQMAVNWRVKDSEFAAPEKVMSFFFKYFLGSFPRFFIFSRGPPHPPCRLISIRFVFPVRGGRSNT